MQLSKTASFYLQASIAVFFIAGSSAPTPLYATYQAAWGFTPITIAVVFGVYALAVLATLLVFGSLSDYIGRRPVLIATSLLQAIAMLLFSQAGGVAALVIARILQGIATGAAMGAVGAGMLDLDRERGTVANAIGPTAGTAIGGIGSGLMVQYLPAPTQLVYFALAAIFVLQAIGVARMAESSSRKPGALASLRPHFLVPPAVQKPLLLAIPVLIATWSLAGFYGSLGPSLVRKLSHANSPVLGGLALFVLAGSAMLAVLYTHARPARAVMTAGCAALMIGVAITLSGVSAPSLGLFFLGTAIAGIGFGAGFQGAIRTVVPLAAAHERAGVLSVLYVVAYLAMGLPAVIAGVFVVYGGGLVATVQGYGSIAIALAAIAMIGMLLPRTAAAPEVAISR